jgi:hypothetical protein
MFSKKQLATLGLLATFLTINALADSADARKGRKCPRGYEDINNVCVFTGHR